ncbi:cephalosporin hydroxylase [candidate division KSB1 bacterium]|nr:cephalosporin hydroxylase [candidate division KSB1 bacterium]
MIVSLFHRIYYYNKERTYGNTYWQGIPLLKCPLDLWIYQEIIYEVKPDIIIECGTQEGGSALYLANILDIIGKGQIVTVDVVEYKNRPKHNRIFYLMGSSTSIDIFTKITNIVKNNNTVMVILDSDHTMDHVLQELKLYGDLVSKSSYLIVEDGNINGHPVEGRWGPGPYEAITTFLAGNDSFTIDRKREKFYLTMNPNGYLKKV